MTKQQYIVQFALKNNNQFTISDLTQIPEVNTYYCNGKKHIGEIVKKMLKMGFITRIKKGTYQLSDHTVKYSQQS